MKDFTKANLAVFLCCFFLGCANIETYCVALQYSTSKCGLQGVRKTWVLEVEDGDLWINPEPVAAWS